MILNECVCLRVEFEERYRDQPDKFRPVVHGIDEELQNHWQNQLRRFAFGHPSNQIPAKLEPRGA